MPAEIHANWVFPKEIADIVFLWAKNKSKPTNGSFVAFKKEKGIVTQECL